MFKKNPVFFGKRIFFYVYLFIMMIEHQSTINPNMPFRLLEYVT